MAVSMISEGAGTDPPRSTIVPLPEKVCDHALFPYLFDFLPSLLLSLIYDLDDHGSEYREIVKRVTGSDHDTKNIELRRSTARAAHKINVG